jgi:hypothetical protein
MISDLVFVLKHIKQVIEEYNLSDLYTNFTNTLQQISQASTPELQQALKDFKTRIKEAHQKLEPEGWSYSQLKIFKLFGAKNIIGIPGLQNFQNALSENAANAAGAIEELNRQREKISQLLTNATNIITSLGDLAKEMEIEKGLTIVQIVFDEKVAIETLPDLFNQSKEWKEIIRAYSLYAGEAPQKTKIVATSKDSPYTIWLATTRLIADAIYKTIEPFVTLYQQILKAKEHALVLEDMKVDVDDKKFGLFKKIDEFERKRIEKIMESIAKINKTKSLDQTQRNEARNALLKSGPKLYNFITHGGKVDTSKRNGNQKVFSSFQLETKYQEVHKLKNRVQQLLTAKCEREKKKEKVEVIKKSVKSKKPKKRGRPGKTE